MQITHYCNSFITATSGKTKIVCDPWVGFGEQNGWLSYPYHNKGVKLLNELKPNYIYISHLHCDHFDTQNLKGYKNKKVTIIIKKFKDKRLKRKIEELGYKNILEIESWKNCKLNNDFSVSIIPQITSNTSKLPEEINYDLDTSIIIKCNKSKEVFFNAVDNPLSVKDLKKVSNFIKKNYKKNVDVMCMPVGAAGEYPQCFLNLNRKNEKNKIIKKGLNELKKQINVIKPNVYFPAGGTYYIFGKFSNLNNFIARPDFFEIRKKFKNDNIELINLEGGNTLFKNDYQWKLKLNKKKFEDKNSVILKYLNAKYFYNKKKITKFNTKYLAKIFDKSKNNYFRILGNFKIKTNWKVEFMIYKNLRLNKMGKIDYKKSNFLRKFNLLKKDKKSKVYSKLVCHLDYQLFYGLLKRKYVWNQPLAGSLILFDRKPNIFDPNVIFSLNFLGK